MFESHSRNVAKCFLFGSVCLSWSQIFAIIFGVLLGRSLSHTALSDGGRSEGIFFIFVEPQMVFGQCNGNANTNLRDDIF